MWHAIDERLTAPPAPKGEEMELNSSDDLAQLLSKMCLATNEKHKYLEQYRIRGMELNSAEIKLIRAKTPQEIEEAKVEIRRQKGLYKELETIVEEIKDCINCLKIQIKAEHA